MHKVNQMNKDTYFFGNYGKMYTEVFSKNTFYEQEFLEHIRSHDLEGIYLDVGGNVGNHAMYFANFCKSVTVHTFEPLERYQRYINENIRANNLEGKVVLHPYGLSDSSTPISFDMGGRNQVVENLMRLDDCGLVLEALCLIKIDVEGNEEKVIDGALKTIEKHKPILYIEVVDSDRLARIDKKLNGIGYRRTENVFNGSPTYEWVPL